MSARLDIDVAIIGGGLVGASAALALARAWGCSVALLEQGLLRRAGERRELWRRAPAGPAARADCRCRSAPTRIWPRLPALIGIDGEFVRSGHLKLARSEADMASLEAYRGPSRAIWASVSS